MVDDLVGTWQDRLVAHLAEVAVMPFQPGVNDCALFAAGAVAAMTGVDHAAPYRGRYATIEEGLELLRADGIEDHVALAAVHLPEIPVSMAQAGDVAAVPVNSGMALGVVQGARVYVLREAGGIGTIGLTRAARAFRVAR